MRVAQASESSVIVYLGEGISVEANGRVLRLFHALAALGDARIRNLHPAYHSLLIDFDPLQLSFEEFPQLLDGCYCEAEAAASEPTRLVKIPVCYHADFAADLHVIAAHAGLAPEEAVRRHAAAEYSVYFLGFAPGFAYLGGLPPELRVPRLASPRKFVAAGSVGIAGAQTGIYPNDSPGGWQLIGRTPLSMFDSAAASPSRLQPGDRVRFVAIGRAEFDRIAREQHP